MGYPSRTSLNLFLLVAMSDNENGENIFESAFLGTHCHGTVVLASYLIGRDGGVTL